METDNELIVKDFRSQFKQERADFELFWYRGERFQYRPFVGYSHVPFASSTLNLNHEGFRGGSFRSKRMESGVRRVAFFGASAMLGIPNTRDSETIPELVKRQAEGQGLKLEVFNFGLMCATIKHELNLALQILPEYDLDMVVLFSGFNDMYLGYSGEVWRAYEDIDRMFEDAFLYNREKNNPAFFAQKMIGSFFKRFRTGVARIAKIDFEKMMQFSARQESANKEVFPTYETNTKVYLECLHQFVALAKYFRIPFVFSHQPSVYATAKQLSRYETAMVDTALDFGLNISGRDYKIEQFRRHYEQQRSAAFLLAKAEGAVVTDAEEHMGKLDKNADIFYDYCHLLHQGNAVVADQFTRIILDTFKA